MAEMFWPTSPAEMVQLSRDCDHCGKPIDFGDPCLELFPGELGRSRRNPNILLVVEETPVDTSQEPQHAWVVHNDCAIEFIIDNVSDALPDSMRTDKCIHCDAPMPPVFCPSCGLPQDEE